MHQDANHQLCGAEAVLGHVRHGQYILYYLSRLYLGQSMQPSQYAHYCLRDDWQQPHDGVDGEFEHSIMQEFATCAMACFAGKHTTIITPPYSYNAKS